MTPSLSERSIIDSTMAPPPGSDRAWVYRPKQSKQWRLGLTCIAFGLVGILPLPKILAWLSGGPMPEGEAFLIVLCLLLEPLGVLWIVNALRGYPRLTTTPEGLSFHNGIGRKWAHWDSLAPFELTEIVTGRFNRRVLTAAARVVGPNASRLPVRAKRFAIPDHFQTPIKSIVDELNVTRTAALGSSHATPPEPAEYAVGLATFTAPWVTLAILAVLIGVFVIENMFPVSPGNAGSPSVPTLIAMGGVSRAIVLESGEWYRLFTAPLLHGGIAHIFLNGIALLLGGRLLERLVGRAWFFTYFVVGALGGSLMSIAVNPANLISVGASGALMGIFAALFVSAFHMPAHSPARQRLQVNSMQVLVPSLLPLASAGAVSQIDYGAHFGGAIAGALLALVLLKAWPQTQALPQLRPLAVGISFLGVILFAGSGGLAAINYSQYDIAMIPPAEMPKTGADQQAQAANLVSRYPKDPRGHLFLGQALAARKDTAGAERELRTALADAQAHTSMFPPQLEAVIRGLLAGLLLDQGRQNDAKDIARPVCSSPAGNQAIDNFRKLLTNQHLCG